MKIFSLKGLSEAFQHAFFTHKRGIGVETCLPAGREVRLYLGSEDTLFEEALVGSLARFFSFAENKLPRAQEPKSRRDFELRFLRKGYRAQLVPEATDGEAEILTANAPVDRRVTREQVKSPSLTRSSGRGRPPKPVRAKIVERATGGVAVTTRQS